MTTPTRSPALVTRQVVSADSPATGAPARATWGAAFGFWLAVCGLFFGTFAGIRGPLVELGVASVGLVSARLGADDARWAAPEDGSLELDAVGSESEQIEPEDPEAAGVRWFEHRVRFVVSTSVDVLPGSALSAPRLKLLYSGLLPRAPPSV